MNPALSKSKVWFGRILSGLVAAFLVFDGVVKFFLDKLPPEAMDAVTALQWPLDLLPVVGTILLLCTLLYIIPRTAILGAILLTGYLGGAIATHVRVNSPLFTHTLFPLYIALLMWLGLLLRDGRLGVLLRGPFSGNNDAL
jgi:DoxX-like family